MSQLESIDIQATFRKLFPTAWINRTAAEVGAVKRPNKVKIPDLFWSIVLGFSAGNNRSLSALRRVFQVNSGINLVSSSYQSRYTSEMAEFLRLCCLRALDHMPGITNKLKGRLSIFKDILITDSSVLRLHDHLAEVYPGCRTNHSKAALKAHMVLSVSGKGKHTLKITDGRHNDGRAFVIGSWIKGKLALFDLGYYVYRNFMTIQEEGGFFISRLKTNANPVILHSNSPCPGNTTPMHEKPLQEVLAKLQRKTLDVMARFDVGHGETTEFRVVASLDAESGDYHLYVTNLPTEKLNADDIVTIYGFRWQIELLFREVKRYYRLEQMPSSRKEVVESLFYAAFITCVLSWRLLQVIRQKLKKQAEFIRLERWAAIFNESAETLLTIMTAPTLVSDYLQQKFLKMVRLEVIDPNKDRLSLLQRTETQLAPWAAGK